MTNTQHSHPFHAVKEAGVTDALKGAGKFLFDEHPLPTYKPTNPGQQTPNWFDKVNPLGTDKGVQRGYKPGWFGRMLGAQEVGPHSIISQPTAGYGEGFANRARTFGHAVGEFGREAILGSPLAVDRQLRAPTASGVGKNYLRMARNFYMPQGRSAAETALGLGMGLAMPAMSIYSAVNGDPSRRGENIGAALGGIASAPITTRLGVPGMLLQHPVQQLGAWVGSKFDPKHEPPKTAGLVGSVAEAAKKHPVSVALAASATLHGAKKLVKSTEDPRTVPTLPSRST